MKLRGNSVLSLIGMSNVGKTFWSKKLAQIGFEHINCDDLIESKLAAELKVLGYSGIQDVARWMGFPHEKQYATNQQKYLAFEKEVMEKIFSSIANSTDKKIVIDTTGSIVHTGDDICQKLKAYSFVVYLDSTSQMKKEQFQKYIEEPKPVVFGDVYSPKENETKKQTLERCYQELLDRRSLLYQKYADVTLSQERIRDISAKKFFELINV